MVRVVACTTPCPYRPKRTERPSPPAYLHSPPPSNLIHPIPPIKNRHPNTNRLVILIVISRQVHRRQLLRRLRPRRPATAAAGRGIVCCLGAVARAARAGCNGGRGGAGREGGLVVLLEAVEERHERKGKGSRKGRGRWSLLVWVAEGGKGARCEGGKGLGPSAELFRAGAAGGGKIGDGRGGGYVSGRGSEGGR